MFYSNFDLDFVDRTVKTSALVLLILFVCGIYYFDFYVSLSILSGGIWGIINLILMKRFIKETFKPDKVDIITVIVIAFIKFPLIYLSGYFLLKIEQFDALFILCGFSIVLAVIILKAIGRVMLGMDSVPRKNKPQKVV